MEKFYIIYLFGCILIISVMLYKHFTNKKENRQTSSPSNNVSENIKQDKEKKENLKHTYDTVNMWTNNCDQKAGILLAIISVVISIIITSDSLKMLKKHIFSPFIEYWSGNSELVFSWSRFICFFLFTIAAFMLLLSCYYLFKTINANIDYEKMHEENPKLAKTSYIFFETISKMTYENFKKDKVEYLDDLRSQIYVNSKIVTTKFQNYIKALYWFRFSLWVSCMLFIAIMIMR